MAEAIVNARLSDDWRAFSAGTEPSGYVHPKAFQVLEEIGIPHEGESKSDAAENCPVWLGKGKRVHLGFPDPAKAQGTDEEVLAVFRSVRDAIADQVPALLARQN